MITQAHAAGFAVGVLLCAAVWAIPQVVALWRFRACEDEQARLQRERFARGQKWGQRGAGALELLIVLGCVALIGLCVWASIVDREDWARFSAQHNCRKVGETQSTISPVYGGKNVQFTTTPGQIGWLCDDGVTYWRNK